MIVVARRTSSHVEFLFEGLDLVVQFSIRSCRLGGLASTVIVVVVVAIVVVSSNVGNPGNDKLVQFKSWSVARVNLLHNGGIDESIGSGLFSQQLLLGGKDEARTFISGGIFLVFVNRIQIVPLKVVVSCSRGLLQASISNGANLVVVEPHDAARKRSNTGRTGAIQAKTDGRGGCGQWCCGGCRSGRDRRRARETCLLVLGSSNLVDVLHHFLLLLVIDLLAHYDFEFEIWIVSVQFNSI